MKQAILITAYKNISQLNELLAAFDENFIFFIHFDKKSKIKMAEIETLKNRFDVRYFSRRYKISWGGVNHLLAILDLLKYANNIEDISHFHLITGQDYPVKSNSEIISFLESNPDKEFIEYNPLPYYKWFEGGFERLDLYNLNDWFYGREGVGRSIVMGFKAIQKRLRIKRSYPKTFPEQIYGGSTYWTLTKNCVANILDYIETNPEYLRRFNFTFCAEEIFFQTIIMNSPFSENVVNDPLRYIIWEKRNRSYPANLDEWDFENIKKSSALFARKIESPYSNVLLEELKNYRETKKPEDI